MVDGTVDTSTTTTTTTTTTAGSLTDQIAAQIRAGVESLCRHHDATTEDVLRIYRDQITNMFLTEQVRSAMRLDPFQHLKEQIPSKDLERIIDSIRVVSHHSVTTMEGYVRTEAVVSLSHFATNNNNINNSSSSSTKKRPRADRPHSEATGALQLHFTYLRSAMTSISPCTVSYTIDVCHTATSTSSSSGGGSPSQPLLWIHVSAAGAVPASHNSHHAIDINKIDVDDDDDDQWSDIDDDEQNGEVVDDVTNDAFVKERQTSRSAVPTENVKHIASTGDTVSELDDNVELKTKNDHHDDDDDIVDRYAAGMDPDVVSVLIAHLTSLNNDHATTTTIKDDDEHEHNYDDVTIFFWLMTFPFYEHEWDLIGFLLQAVFDNDDDNSIVDGDDVSDNE